MIESLLILLVVVVIAIVIVEQLTLPGNIGWVIKLIIGIFALMKLFAIIAPTLHLGAF